VPKKKNEFLEVERRKHSIHAMEWMSYRVGDILGKQVFAKVEDVFSCLLDRAVLGFCDAPSENVDAAFVVREVGAYFLAEDDSWQVSDFEATGNGILIRDGHKIHPRHAESGIEFLRIRIARRKIQTPKNPVGRALAMSRVNV
jgi:hypothetical protein